MSESEESPPVKREKGSSLLVSGALVLISAYVFIASFSIPAPEGWQTAPGMLPMLLGGSLCFMAILISIEAIQNGAWISLKEMITRSGPKEESETPLWRGFSAAAMIGIFFFFLVPHLHFEIAAAIFIFAMTTVFWTGSSIVRRLLLAVLLPFFITISFHGFFGIPMPGETNFVQEVLFHWKRQAGGG